MEGFGIAGRAVLLILVLCWAFENFIFNSLGLFFDSLSEFWILLKDFNLFIFL